MGCGCGASVVDGINWKYSLPSISAHKLAFGKDVPFHSLKQLRLRGSAPESKDRIQGVHSEVVSVSPTRRARASIAQFRPTVGAVFCSIG